MAPYTATKGAIKNLTRGMCTDWAKYGLQVNAIAPGYFKTPLHQALVDDPAFSAWLEKRTPAARWGNVEELVGAAVFLSGKASSFVNGHTLYVDGGITTSREACLPATRWAEFRFGLRKRRASLMKFCTTIDVSFFLKTRNTSADGGEGQMGLNTISSVVKRAIDCGTSATPKPAAIRLGTDCASTTCCETRGRKPASMQHFCI